MIALILLMDAPDALAALLEALGKSQEVGRADVVIDPVPHVEDGVRFHRWLVTGGRELDYPDTILNEDGESEPIVRATDGGYVSSDGEGRWAVLVLDANAHMFEEAADMLSGVDPDWGRYEEE